MLAVLLYEHVTNKPAGIPDVWPAEVREVIELPSPDWLEMSEAELEAYKATHQATYDTWYQSIITVDASTQYVSLINNAKMFANEIITTAIAENIAMGITQAGKTKLILDTLKDVYYYLQAGSLYEVLTAVDAITVTQEMSPFITTARLTTFKNKIRVYLGLPPL
jgi:hypothetical protein